MKKILVLISLGLMLGCGDNHAVNTPTPEEILIQRAMDISLGKIQPTEEDFKNLDVAPLVNGESQPNGIIDIGDVIVLIRRYKGVF